MKYFLLLAVVLSVGFAANRYPFSYSDRQNLNQSVCDNPPPVNKGLSPSDASSIIAEVSGFFQNDLSIAVSLPFNTQLFSLSYLEAGRCGKVFRLLFDNPGSLGLNCRGTFSVDTNWTQTTDIGVVAPACGITAVALRPNEMVFQGAVEVVQTQKVQNFDRTLISSLPFFLSFPTTADFNGTSLGEITVGTSGNISSPSASTTPVPAPTATVLSGNLDSPFATGNVTNPFGDQLPSAHIQFQTTMAAPFTLQLAGPNPVDIVNGSAALLDVAPFITLAKNCESQTASQPCVQTWELILLPSRLDVCSLKSVYVIRYVPVCAQGAPSGSCSVSGAETISIPISVVSTPICARVTPLTDVTTTVELFSDAARNTFTSALPVGATLYGSFEAISLERQFMQCQITDLFFQPEVGASTRALYISCANTAVGEVCKFNTQDVLPGPPPLSQFSLVLTESLFTSACKNGTCDSLAIALAADIFAVQLNDTLRGSLKPGQCLSSVVSRAESKETLRVHTSFSFRVNPTEPKQQESDAIHTARAFITLVALGCTLLLLFV